MNDPKAEM
jgi:hypothetical protein